MLLSDQDVDPLEVLRADLSDRSVEVQLEAIKNIPTIALAIGPEKAKDKMIAIIDAYCNTDDDDEAYAIQKKDGSLGANEEVLREIALVLNISMIPLLGGKENILPLLILLQKLPMIDETVIREAAVNTIISFAEALDGDYVDRVIFSVVTPLTDSPKWGARMGAAGALPRLHQYFISEKCRVNCQDMIFKLSRDKMPLVRHECLSNIQLMVQPMGDHSMMELLDFIVPILKNLTQEPQEYFRFLLIEILKVLLQFENEDLMGVCEEFLTCVFNDFNWRIRTKLLAALPAMARSAPSDFINNIILPHYINCFLDPESLVRVDAIKMAPEFLSQHCFLPEKIKELVPWSLIMELVKDEFPEVQKVTSGAVLDILAITYRLGITEEDKDMVIHIMDKFYFDECGEVRMNFCRGLRKALEFCGEQYFVTRLLPLVPKLQEDAKWRVRAAVCENIQLLAELHKKNKLTEQEFCKILESAFKDPIAEARKCAIESVPVLVDILGPDWVLQKVLKVVTREFNVKTKYQWRFVPIRIAAVITNSFPGNKKASLEELHQSAVAVLIEGCEDSISNVRLASVHAIADFIKNGETADYIKELQAALEALKEDQDCDVRDAALVALELL